MSWAMHPGRRVYPSDGDDSLDSDDDDDDDLLVAPKRRRKPSQPRKPSVAAVLESRRDELLLTTCPASLLHAPNEGEDAAAAALATTAGKKGKKASSQRPPSEPRSSASTASAATTTAVAATTTATPVPSLPHEVLFLILQSAVSRFGAVPLLCRTSRVSRLWNAVSSDPLLWRSVDLSNCADRLSLQRWQSLAAMHRWTRLEQISLANNAWLVDSALANLVAACPTLTAVDVAGCWRISPVGLRSLLGLPKLTSFTARGGEPPLGLYASGSSRRDGGSSQNAEDAAPWRRTDPLTPAFLSELATTHPELKELSISFAHLEGISSFESLRLLTSLNLCFVKGYVHAVELVRCFPNLESLFLAELGEHLPYPALLLQDRRRATPQPGLTHLRHFICTSQNPDFAQSVRTDVSTSVMGLITPSLSLETLNLEGMCGTQALAFHEILATRPIWRLNLSNTRATLNATALKRLKIAFVLPEMRRQSTYRVLKAWVTNLKELYLDRCSWADGSLLDVMVKIAREETNKMPLRILSLVGSRPTAKPLARLIGVAPYLVVVDLTSCRGIPRGFKRRFKGRAAILELQAELDRIGYESDSASGSEDSSSH
ncbi:hypothetical protein CAOG_00202 [Capsaspora owczarzaki ATCC 30864]|uniref:hypothetical protein n=1 Tax=Capsaspora owczarzaki (strain ATCC 30864) TaxID=595528 RepID=UPI0001FE2DD7|nr:hypothetical protein CAOG_00202 [Capsaspora owczarzaki ATCC 30864]|eukprot:XP_004365073.1 hypothetical protein CAOG_00202 [Capsaspora owczarzaki ATCC 30864]